MGSGPERAPSSELLAFIAPVVGQLARELSAESSEKLGRPIDPVSFALGTLLALLGESGYDPSDLLFNHAKETNELLDAVAEPPANTPT